MLHSCIVADWSAVIWTNLVSPQAKRTQLPLTNLLSFILSTKVQYNVS